jgi:hypothetical protein
MKLLCSHCSHDLEAYAGEPGNLARFLSSQTKMILVLSRNSRRLVCGAKETVSGCFFAVAGALLPQQQG